MVREISASVRAEVLWDAGHRTPKSLMRRGNIPLRTAERYISKLRKGESLECKQYTRRAKPSKTPQLVRKVIKKANNRRHAWTSREIGSKTRTSHTQVQRILNDNGYKYKKYKKRVRVNADTRKDRVEFAEEMQDKESDWGFIFFTDECSFWLNRSKPGKLWTQDAMDEEVSGGAHGPKVHCWGAISARGALDIELFEENLTAVHYVSILKKRLVSMQELYPEGWIWQQDGSSVHRAEESFYYTYENMPQKLKFPSYSPDLSPIENVWGWLKGEVNKDMPTSVETLKRCIRKHWNRITPAFLKPYFDSMP